MLCVTGSVRSAGDTQPLRAAGGVAAGLAYLVLDPPRHMRCMGVARSLHRSNEREHIEADAQVGGRC